MEEFTLNEAQLALWIDKKGFQRGIIVGIGLAADELTTLVVILAPDIEGNPDANGGELARIQKQIAKWKKVTP